MSDYEKWYDEAKHESNAAGYAGVTVAQTIIAHQAAHITELEAQLADAKKDAERYQWLRTYMLSTDMSHDDNIINATSWADFDVVIDTAIAEGKA